jgi:hypothetical protein
MEPVTVNVPVDGSYNSAALQDDCTIPLSPKTSTFPFSRRVAEPELRVSFGPVAAKVPEDGSYNSAVEP